jgi:hypothetical protein
MNRGYRCWFSKLNGGLRLLALFVSILLLLPKIDLIPITGASAIRFDDILLFLMILLLFINFLKSSRKIIIKVEWIFALLFLYMVFSNILNISFFERSNILYSIRYIEYFAFFYAGFYFSQKYSLQKLLKYYLYVTAIFVFIQYFGNSIHHILPTFIHRNGVITGLTAGPWELGAVLNIILVVYAFKKNNTRMLIFKVFVVTSLFIILTGSRSPFAVHLFILICYLFFSVSYKNKIFLFLSLPIIAIIGNIIFSNISLPIKDRSKKLFSYDNSELVEKYFDTVEISPLGLGFDNNEIKDSVNKNIGDLSWAIRSMKWVYSVKLWLENDISIFFGVGPGTLGRAIDGGIIRVLTEFGIIGFIIYFYLLYKIAVTYGIVAIFIVLSLIMNMLMIDIHNAYKVMSLFYFIIGVLAWKKYQQQLIQ